MLSCYILTIFYRSSAQVAWDQILTNHGPPEVLTCFRQIFRDSEDLDDYCFSLLHRIVLQLETRDLLTYLRTCSQTDVDRSDAQGYTSLHWAARRGDSRMVELLLRSGADPNIPGYRGQYALHYAACCGDVCGVHHILNYGADVNAMTSLQYTLLCCTFTFSMPNSACAKRLIDRGAIVDTHDYQGATPLLWASQYNSVPGMRCLLDNGANPNLPTHSGEMPLTVAVQVNAHEGISLLLAHGANPAHLTLSGRSLLHEAAEWADEETLQVLTSAQIQGLDIMGKSADGYTAWDLVRRREGVTSEWRAAFANLLASVRNDKNTRTDKNIARPSPRYFTSLSTSRRVLWIWMSEIAKIIAYSLHDGIVIIYQRSTRLLPQQVLLSAVLAVFLAVAWYTLMQA